MTPNQLPSDGVALVSAVDPISQGAGSPAQVWTNVKNFHSFLAVLDVGVFGGSATVDFKLQQATDSSGTGAKDITGKSITQLVAAGGNNRQAMINARASDMDQANSFNFISFKITVGTAATLVAAAMYGFYPRFEPVKDPGSNPAINLGASSVAQIVS
ncbi:MAG: hypothetical protein ACREUY_02090 [Burkholderiales bacterium]